MYRICYWLVASTLFFILGCTDEKHETIEKGVFRTVIVYMVADNDLSVNAYENIDKIVEGVTSIMGNNKILIYLDPVDTPQLIEISYLNGRKNIKTIRDYPEQNSLDSTIMRSVLLEIIDKYPSESYGLVLWSHGTSWLPPNSVLKSFGDDNGKEMDILLLEQSLPLKFEFIIFDACLMGSIEVAYQFRNKANYILSSPTEVLSTGYPYDLIVSDFFGGVEEFKNIAFSFFAYYNSQNGAYQSASVSLIGTKRLDCLAEKSKSMLANWPIEKWTFTTQFVQNFDVGNSNLTYDYIDFLDKNYPSCMVNEIKLVFDEIIIVKYHTPNFLEKISITRFCGLGCYVPNHLYSGINQYYRRLAWYADAGYEVLF